MKNRFSRGFTLIELLVVVVVIGILAAIALPNFIGAQRKAKHASVKNNMHTSQVAAESYSVDIGGAYPAGPGMLIFYMPGGGNSMGGAMGIFPTNPITGIPNQVPAQCVIISVAQIVGVRTLAGQRNLGGGAGQTTYSGVADSNNANIRSTYAITGNDESSLALKTDVGFFVLSNM